MVDSLLMRISDEIAGVIESVAPSIVEIKTLKVLNKRWFAANDRGFMPAGAGVILKADGLIVTNHHVVQGTKRVRVSLSDRRSFEAELSGLDPVADVAAIRIPPTGLRPARLRNDGGVRLGEVVFAVGHPLGLTGSVSTGIVSSPARFQQGPGAARPRVYIQTDAAINPGNSGGALVGCDGAVLGITTWGITAEDVHGLSFAIPIATAARIAEKLLASKAVRYGTLGVFGGEMYLPADAVKAHGLQQNMAFQIDQVEPDSPAAAVGLEQYDWIVSIGERRIDSLEKFLDAVDDFIDAEVEIRIVRVTGELATKRVKIATLRLDN